jgi:putative signal transducing protein
MKKVFSSHILPTAEHVQKVLELQGIISNVSGESLALPFGDLPPIDVWPAVWVDDEDEEQALRIISELELEESKSEATWKCIRCGEESENRFDACWKCGAAKSDQ